MLRASTPADQHLTESTLCRKNIRPRAFDPVHDLLKRLEGDALLSIFETEQARRRDSEFPCIGSIRRLSPPFAKKSRKFLVQRLPHGETLNDLAFLMRNVLIVLFHKGNALSPVSEHKGM